MLRVEYSKANIVYCYKTNWNILSKSKKKTILQPAGNRCFFTKKIQTICFVQIESNEIFVLREKIKQFSCFFFAQTQVQAQVWEIFPWRMFPMKRILQIGSWCETESEIATSQFHSLQIVLPDRKFLISHSSLSIFDCFQMRVHMEYG